MEVCNNPAEEIFCLERLLRLRPDHPWAQQRLQKARRAAPELVDGGQGAQPRSRRSLLLAIPLVIAALLLCVGAAYGYQRISSSAKQEAAAKALATQATSCQELINMAVKASGDSCEQLGPNGVCYGNLTLKAETVSGTGTRFSQRGDQLPVKDLRSLSASPLNLQNGDWGVAIFRMMANLPRSLPGEMVTLFVFGNTTLSKDSDTLETFYFHSQLGEIVCDKVPFDGVLVTLPEGSGVHIQVNGTDLVLMGNASLKAEANKAMEISLYSGSASVSSAGETEYFGAGKKVSVPLGGPNGDSASGPPGEPIWLSQAELNVSCSLTGQFCTTADIFPVDAAQAQSNIEAAAGTSGAEPPALAVNTLAPAVTLTPEPTQTFTRTATLTATGSRTPLPSFTPFPTRTPIPPTATITPTRTRTPVSSNTPSATPNRTQTLVTGNNRTATAIANQTATAVANQTAVAAANQTATANANLTATANANQTATAGVYQTGTASVNQTATAIFNQTATAIANLTATVSANQTATAGANQTSTAISNMTATALAQNPCLNLSARLDSGGGMLNYILTNNSQQAVTITHVTVTWNDEAFNQSLEAVMLNGFTPLTPPLFTKDEPPADFNPETDWLRGVTIDAGDWEVLQFYFKTSVVRRQNWVETTFSNGCVVSDDDND